MPWGTKVRYVYEIASGMFFLHSLKCIHRDLKSDNVLISRSNHLKISDFGTVSESELLKRPPARCEPSLILAR